MNDDIDVCIGRANHFWFGFYTYTHTYIQMYVKTKPQYISISEYILISTF